MKHRLALPFAFFCSGAAALLFEVLWFRLLGRVVGNTVWAAAIVLAAFMLGLALGGMLAARGASRVRRPARAFAFAEATVAAGGTLLVLALPEAELAAGRWLAPFVGHEGALDAARFALALAAMVVPTTAMGMTLAFGVRLLADRETSRALGLLYAANTFGACVAPLAAEYLLIEALGMRGTALAAAGLDLIAAWIAVRAFDAEAEEPSVAADRGARAPLRLVAAAALSGALALGLEVIWFRLLLLFEPGVDTTFALMLAVVLVGIALGGAIAPRLARAGFAWIAGLGAAAVVLGYRLLAHGAGAGLLLDAALLMAPASLVSGVLFTLLGAELRGGARNPQAAIGTLMSANTLGAAAGSALAGLVLLPSFGMERSLLALAAGYAALPLVATGLARWRRALAPSLVALAAVALFPFGQIRTHLAAAAATFEQRDGGHVVRVVEGPTTTLQLVRADLWGEPYSWRLVTDSYSMTALNIGARRYMDLFAWLALDLHPDPRRALLISYGAGNTARSLLSDPGLRHLDVVDLSPEILSMSPVIHGADDPLRDPRVRVVREDGRHFLRTRDDTFDIITSEPPPPAMAGVVNLYTREYFEAVAARLAPGGIATYWLPMHSFESEGARAVTAAFCEVFPDCTLWAGTRFDWILAGSRGGIARADEERFVRLWKVPAVRERLAVAGFEKPEQIGAAFLADAEQLRTWTREIPPVTDNWPKRLGGTLVIDGNTAFGYASLADATRARERFIASTWIAAHWPAALRERSVDYFDAQNLLVLWRTVIRPDALGPLDAMVRGNDLRAPVLWLLGSDDLEQGVLAKRAESDADAFARAAGALAARDFARAAAGFERAAAREPDRVGALAAYAWCRAGDPARARTAPGAGRLEQKLRCW